MFERKFVETKVENQNTTSRKGSTNSTSSYVKTKFENKSKACRGTIKFAKYIF
jgi:hypothetical protein